MNYSYGSVEPIEGGTTPGLGGHGVYKKAG